MIGVYNIYYFFNKGRPTTIIVLPEIETKTSDLRRILFKHTYIIKRKYYIFYLFTCNGETQAVYKDKAVTFVPSDWVYSELICLYK